MERIPRTFDADDGWKIFPVTVLSEKSEKDLKSDLVRLRMAIMNLACVNPGEALRITTEVSRVIGYPL